ncbi:hypothetical protein AB0J82_28385 [Asanoa sp. NPDC049518]|uniref:hypothetical protein n=1 Tax=unclassified Asanoa TaxID=2685164 RepID=UPI003430D33A
MDPGGELRYGGMVLDTDGLVEVDYRTIPAGTVEAEPGPADPEAAASSGLPTMHPSVQPTSVEATEPSGRIASNNETARRTLSPGLQAWVTYLPGGDAQADAIANGLRPTGEPHDATTWPRRPLG